MAISYPNQRIIKIHRDTPTKDFLGIKIQNWYAASRALGAHALRLYLYLCSNKDGFDINLSPAAIEAAIGMPRSTYHDQFRKLINLGYIVPKSGNRFDFYEIPQPTPEPKPQAMLNFDEPAAIENSYEISTHTEQTNPTNVYFNPPEEIEININI